MIRRISRAFGPVCVAAALLPLVACGSLNEAVSTPKISAMAYPTAIVPSEQAVLQAPENGARPASSNSLWRNGARAFFHDQRAARVGDILTVNININDTAKLSNETVATRKGANQLGVPNLLGFETTLSHNLPKSFSAGTAVGTSSSFTNDGSGSVNRSETVSLTVAAVVNGELRELLAAGVIRPEDIASDNTIPWNKIAEARISYGGQGTVSRVQNVPAGTAILQKFSPF